MLSRSRAPEASWKGEAPSSFGEATPLTRGGEEGRDEGRTPPITPPLHSAELKAVVDEDFFFFFFFFFPPEEGALGEDSRDAALHSPTLLVGLGESDEEEGAKRKRI